MSFGSEIAGEAMRGELRTVAVVALIAFGVAGFAGYQLGVRHERAKQDKVFALFLKAMPPIASDAIAEDSIPSDQVEEYGILGDRPYASSFGETGTVLTRESDCCECRPTAGVEVRKRGNAFRVDNVGLVAIRVMCDETPKYGPFMRPGELLIVDPGDTPARCDKLYLEALIPMSTVKEID